MLRAYGHEVILYGSERNEAEVDEYVITVTDELRTKWFDGPWDTSKVFDRWDPDDECWREFNNVVIDEIRPRFQSGDLVGIIAGRCQQLLADAFPCVEWGVGYGGICPNTHRAFESRAWQHYVYGQRGYPKGFFFDTVIPNAYDPADLVASPNRPIERPYFLYMGRMNEDKGLPIVREIAKHHKVVTAGQGEPLDGCDHFGVVRGTQKASLLRHARAVLVPSLYIEPFGGVAVEAMMCGTPVITTDWGAFPETVMQGVTGFRCNTLPEFFEACEKVDSLSYEYCHNHGMHFSLKAVAPLYDKWLHRVQNQVYGEGWYAP